MTTPYLTPVVVPLLANDTDPDNDPLTVTSAILADPSTGTLVQNPTTLAWTFTPAAGFSGDAVINYTMTIRTARPTRRRIRSLWRMRCRR